MSHADTHTAQVIETPPTCLGSHLTSSALHAQAQWVCMVGGGGGGGGGASENHFIY